MRVAVVGVGVMGSAIAGRLLDRGCEVALFNRTPARCAPLAARGAIVSSSPGEAARSADYIALSLNGADIVEDVVFGADGVASTAGRGAVVVDFSSIDPARTAAMAARLRESTGIAWVDAPLSGGAPAAARGTMTLMVGGTEDDVTRARPLLDLLAARATHLGPAGAGQAVKLVNQVLVGAAFVALAEAVRLAEVLGVDASLVPQALAGGRADSRLMQEFMSKMARRDYSPSGRIANMVKDLDAAQAAARSAGADLPLTDLVLDVHRRLVAQGLGDADNAALMELFDPSRVPRS